MSRIYKGARRQDIGSAPSKQTFAEIDSAFQIQEYIAQVIQSNPHDVGAIVQPPGTRAFKDSTLISTGGIEEHKEPVDEACWIYEQLRRLAQDLSHPLISTLQAECSRQSCPEMKAGEWLYLCVAHGGTTSGAMEQCCAIDYIMHTLDSATSLLNSPRAFPSRLQIPPASNRHFSSLARRLSRIFAHAYYHHREAFEQAELESSLYARFLLMARQFDLVPAEFLVLPTPGSSSIPTTQLDGLNVDSSASSHNALSSSTLSAVQSELGLESTNQSASQNRPITLLGRGNDTETPGEGEAERRMALNRSRTDTMYMPDFDLAKLAAEAGIDIDQDFRSGQEEHEKRESRTVAVGNNGNNMSSTGPMSESPPGSSNSSSATYSSAPFQRAPNHNSTDTTPSDRSLATLTSPTANNATVVEDPPSQAEGILNLNEASDSSIDQSAHSKSTANPDNLTQEEGTGDEETELAFNDEHEQPSSASLDPDPSGTMANDMVHST
ncbi:hypothetical protein FRC02_006332 [Tulasnella sp. 418]|nr:hypothetical protein FRC02_006332 [Tulasnella sp. 418]